MARSDYLYDLLPPIFVEHDRSGQLYALMRILQSVEQELSAGIECLYDDIFVETCATGKLPRIAALLGIDGVRGDWPHQRALVADMIAFRRRRGTLLVLPAFATAVTGWPASVEFERGGGKGSIRLSLSTDVLVEDSISGAAVPPLPGQMGGSIFAFHPLALPVQAMMPEAAVAPIAGPVPADSIPRRLSPGPTADRFSLDLDADLATAERLETLRPPADSWPCLAYGPGRALRLTRRTSDDRFEEVPPWEVGATDLARGELPPGDFPIFLSQPLPLDSKGQVGLRVSIGEGEIGVVIDAPETLAQAAKDLQVAIRQAGAGAGDGFVDAEVIALDGGLAVLPGGGRPYIVGIRPAPGLPNSPVAVALQERRPCIAARSARFRAPSDPLGTVATLAVRIGTDQLDMKVDWTADNPEALARILEDQVRLQQGLPAFKAATCRALGDRLILIGGEAGMPARVVGRGAARALFPSASVWVDSAVGLVAMAGAAPGDVGGRYFRAAPPLGCDLRSGEGPDSTATVACDDLSRALAGRSLDVEIVIGPGRANLKAIALSEGETLTLRAARAGSTLLSAADGLSVTAGRGAKLVLRGLLVDGPIVLVDGEVDLEIHASTLRPGPFEGAGNPVSIRAAGPATIRLSGAIVGPIAAGEHVIVEASDTVIGMDVAPAGLAIAGLPDDGAEPGAGGRLRLERVTLLAGVKATAIQSVRDSLAAGPVTVPGESGVAGTDRTDAPDEPPGLAVARLCDAAWPHPQFAQAMREGTPPASLRPTADGGDRGAYHRAGTAARVAALCRALPTMLPIAAPAFEISLVDRPDECWTCPFPGDGATRRAG